MPPNPFAKLFSWLCACAFVFFIVAMLRSDSITRQAELSYHENLLKLKNKAEKVMTPVKDETNLIHEDLKYILQWTPGDHSPFDWMGKGRSAFVDQDCEFTNCYVTDNRIYFLDISDFDAVAFHGKEIQANDLPKKRSPKQKYIFASMESASYYPVCNPVYNNYFNWTFTYRLDSDVRWGYVTVYDLAGNKVAPAVDVKWPKKNSPISEDLKEILSSKTKAVAWFVSNCQSKSKRQEFVNALQKELAIYGMSVDVFGSCGPKKCPRAKTKECNKMLAKDYFFYLSFENSFAEDYVTEKLHTAVDNFAVPVVYGGADYTRFLPPGSYLNARELGAKELARTMNEVIQDKTRDQYHDFFRWRNHYYIELTSESADICNLCAMMNDHSFREISVYKDFGTWWNPPDLHC